MTTEADDVIAALTDLCRKHGIKCIVDVGSCEGHEAAIIRDAIGCRAVLIDGDPNVKPEDGQEFYRTLIGSSDSVMTFYVNGNLGLSTEISRAEGSEVAMELPQQRLDTFCAEHNIAPDALLVDTEGSGMDVLEGCGDILGGVKLIYIELQTSVLRPGIRLLDEAIQFLSVRGFTQHHGLPSYDAGGQGNYTFLRCREADSRALGQSQ